MSKEIESVILFQIDRTSKVAKQHTQKEFDRLNLGITIDQWVLLKIIEESKELSQRELAEKSVRDPASITRTLDILEKKELIRRENMPNSRRQYRIILTKQGQAFVNKNMEMIKKHRAQSMKGFSIEEQNLLIDMLQRIQDNMR